MPGRANLAMYQGDDYSQRVSFVEPDGTPIPMPGITFTAQVRADYADAAPLVLADLECTFDDELGELVLSLDHALTETLPTEDVLRWDLQATDTAGEVTTYLAGTVKVSAEVTR
jgi:hypothetical protein